MLWVRDKGLRP